MLSPILWKSKGEIAHCESLAVTYCTIVSWFCKGNFTKYITNQYKSLKLGIPIQIKSRKMNVIIL